MPFDPTIIRNRKGKEPDWYLKKRFPNKRGEIERYFSRKKRVFNLGEERTRTLKNFRANCYLTSIMEILEWTTKPELWVYYSADSNSNARPDACLKFSSSRPCHFAALPTSLPTLASCPTSESSCHLPSASC